MLNSKVTISINCDFSQHGAFHGQSLTSASLFLIAFFAKQNTAIHYLDSPKYVLKIAKDLLCNVNFLLYISVLLQVDSCAVTFKALHTNY